MEMCLCGHQQTAHGRQGDCGAPSCSCLTFRRKDPKTVEADFIPNEQVDRPLHHDDGPITPPMTAKEFKRHCKRIAEDRDKPMVTRLAAFGLGAFVEGVTEGIDEVLGNKKKSKRLKR